MKTVEELAQRVTAVEERLKNMQYNMDKIIKTIYGNGGESLIEKVASLETNVSNQKKLLYLLLGTQAGIIGLLIQIISLLIHGG